jgi:hypothetical protein
MASPYPPSSLFAQAAFGTAALFTFSLVSKLLLETPGEGVSGSAHELLRQAIHWRDVAAQDADDAMRLQHASTAAALLQAARTIARDSDLELVAGVDVPRLARSLQARVTDARQNVQAEAPAADGNAAAAAA